MRAVAVVLLLAGAAHAQAPAEPEPSGLVAARSAIGAACGVSAGLVTAYALDGNGAQTPVALVAFVGTTAACVWHVGREQGHTGRFLPTLGDTALGLGAGILGAIGVGYVVYYAAGGDNSRGVDELFNTASLAALAAAAATFAVAPAVVAAYRLPRHNRVAVAPAALRAPDGTSAPGVALRFDL